MDNSEYTDVFQYLKYGMEPQNKYKDFVTFSKQFSLRDDRMFKDNRQVIPRYDVEKYLALYHDDPTAAHFSAQVIYDKMKSRYVWTTMRKDIEYIVKHVMNVNVEEVQNVIIIYILLNLPTSLNVGNRYYGTFTSYSTRKSIYCSSYRLLYKMAEARPLKNANAQAVADFIYDEIICRFGPPAEIQSDQGTHFRNEMITALNGKI
jgi:hypothetical protein